MKNYSEEDIKNILSEKIREPTIIIDWGKGVPENCNIYYALDRNTCWYIIYSYNNNNTVASSKILLLDRETNKVLYDGSCNDEG